MGTRGLCRLAKRVSEQLMTGVSAQTKIVTGFKENGSHLISNSSSLNIPLFPLGNVCSDNAALAARWHSNVLQTVALMVSSICSPYGVDIGVLLVAAGRIGDAWVYVLARLLVYSWVAQHLIECLCEVGHDKQLQHHALLVDASIPGHSLRHCGTTV